MSYKAHTFVVTVLGIGLSLLEMAPAAGAVLSWEQTASGRTGAGTATSYLDLPTSDTYGRTFLSPTPQIATTGFGFYDDFVFSIANASADALTSTIDFSTVLGIDNLQVRLYNLMGNTNPPVLGTPNGGVIEGWSQTFNLAPGTNEIVNVLGPKSLSAGNYVLEVRGNVTGSAGGSYSGSLNLIPTPLPAALPLLLGGLGLLGATRRRSLRSAAV